MGGGRIGRRAARLPLAALAVGLLLSGCAVASPTTIPVPTVVAPTAAPPAAPAPTTAPEAAALAPATAPAPTAPAAAPEPATLPAGAEPVLAADGVMPTAAPAAAAATGVGGASDTAGASAPAAAQAEPTPRPPAPPDPGTGLSTIYEKGPNDRLQVALTFDAGADTGYASQILDFLDQQGIKATFGMTGLWAQANPDLVRRMAADGHQLINHTWDHASLTGANTNMPPMTADQLAQELGSTEDLVRQITGGYEMKPYFRPPYGDYDEASLRLLEQDGYTATIWWTCDTRGWAGWSADKIVGYCTTDVLPHEIVLMHVGAAAAGDFEALPGLVDWFRQNGYAFVTVEQMLQP